MLDIQVIELSSLQDHPVNTTHVLVIPKKFNPSLQSRSWIIEQNPRGYCNKDEGIIGRSDNSPCRACCGDALDRTHLRRTEMLSILSERYNKGSEGEEPKCNEEHFYGPFIMEHCYDSSQEQ